MYDWEERLEFVGIELAYEWGIDLGALTGALTGALAVDIDLNNECALTTVPKESLIRTICA